MIIVPSNVSAVKTAWDNTVALLNFNGADGATTFTDSSPLASNWSASGAGVLSTSNFKFGSASLYCSGTGYAVASAATSNFAFDSTQDFTIEVWAYPTSWVSAYSHPLVDSRWGGTSYYTLYLSGTSGTGAGYVTWDRTTLKSDSPISLNQWTHIAVCRSSGTLRMFVNGTQTGGNVTDTNAYTSVGTSRPMIGGDGNGPGATNYKYVGYIDSVRITRSARYTASFTAPTAEFSVGV